VGAEQFSIGSEPRASVEVCGVDAEDFSIASDQGGSAHGSGVHAEHFSIGSEQGASVELCGADAERFSIGSGQGASAEVCGAEAERFNIGDQMAPRLLPQQAQQFCEVAKSLESAASALRLVVGQNTSLGHTLDETSAFFKDGSFSFAGALPASPARANVPKSPGSYVTSPSCIPALTSPNSIPALRHLLTGAAEGSLLDDDRLTKENELLRGALGDAVRRLAELEGEKERFMSEDVFDLVNSLCRSEC